MKVEASMYRERGRWHLLVFAPRWAVSDLVNEARDGGGIHFASYGGPSSPSPDVQHSFLIASKAKP